MEKLLICKKCKSNLVQVGKKYVCSNENCDFQKLAISKNWHEELANDSTVWNENIIKKAPSIIAYEYEKLRKLLLSGSTYGVQLQIKDLFEVILKFPALIILAESLQTKKKKEEYNDILHFMTSKQLSLGDWSQMANSILKKELKRDDVMIYLLKDVYEIYKKHNIISWRNDNIGHGALKLDDSMDFQTDIKKMLNLIFAHFNRCEKWYIDIILNLKSKGQYSPLIGESMARNINLTTGVPVVKVDRKYIELDPLIQYENKGIYFFDSYGSIKNIASLINYPSGDKIKQKPTPIGDLYKSLKKKNNILIASASAEEKIYLRAQADTINRITEPSNFIRFTFLENKIKTVLEEKDKGIILLQMENGMGKTTFSKMLDNLFYNQVKYDGVTCRAYYINDILSYSPVTFISKVSDVLRQVDRNGEFLEGEIPTVNALSGGARIDVSQLINILFEYHKKYYSKEKLLLVIDGIDEIASTAEKSLINLIPDTEMLEKGIYILLTCRTDNQISQYTKSALNSMQFDKKILFEKQSYDYQQLLKDYITARTKAGETEVLRILDLSDGKFINIDILIKAYIEYGFDAINTLSIIAEENFLYLLRKLYGEIYFEEIIKMLAVLSLSSVPVSIKQLSRMCGEDKVTFKQLCYLEELRPLVNIIRTAQGNDISIHRREIIDMINNNYNSVVDRLIIDWYEEVISIVKETNGKPFDEVDLKFILNILTILSNINLSEVPFKIGKNISPLMDSLLSNLHKDGAYLDEQLHQSYYMFYHNINKLIKEYLKKGIEFDSDFYLRLLGNISEVFLNSGDIDFALDKLREGLDLLKKSNVKISAFTTAQAYGKIAALYSKIGNKDEAEIYFQLASETAEAVEKALPHNNYRKILSFYTKAEGKIKEATHYKNRARYDKAIDVLNKLLNEIFEIEKGEFKDDPLVKTIKLSCYKIYGNIYKRTNPSKALQYMFQAQELLPVFYKHDEVKAKGTESDLLLNIGQVYRQLNQPATAMQCYDKALKINDELLQSGGTIPCEEVCILYNSKGNIERDLRNHSKSIEYYTQAIEYYEKCQREGKSIVPNLYVSSLISRSEAYSALGKYTEAQKDNQKAQKINFDYEQVMHTLRGKH